MKKETKITKQYEKGFKDGYQAALEIIQSSVKIALQRMEVDLPFFIKVLNGYSKTKQNGGIIK